MIARNNRNPLTEKKCNRVRQLLRSGHRHRDIATALDCGIDVVYRIEKGLYVPAEQQTNKLGQVPPRFKAVDGGLPIGVESRTMQLDFDLPDVLKDETMPQYLERLERTGAISEAVYADGSLCPLPLTIDMRCAAIRKWNGPKVMATRTMGNPEVAIPVVPVMHAMAAISESQCEGR